MPQLSLQLQPLLLKIIPPFRQLYAATLLLPCCSLFSAACLVLVLPDSLSSLAIVATPVGLFVVSVRAPTTFIVVRCTLAIDAALPALSTITVLIELSLAARPRMFQ